MEIKTLSSKNMDEVVTVAILRSVLTEELSAMESRIMLAIREVAEFLCDRMDKSIEAINKRLDNEVKVLNKTIDENMKEFRIQVVAYSEHSDHKIEQTAEGVLVHLDKSMQRWKDQEKTNKSDDRRLKRLEAKVPLI